MKIQVKEKNRGEFLVTLKTGESESQHAVELDDEYYQRLTGGAITEKELIKKSFEFLLKRESKESILSRFNLEVISRYFPEYEGKIRVV
ncbi:hypothetical protein JXI42_04895 [bacterium]|nr:hypothetical protein [bacterium]